MQKTVILIFTGLVVCFSSFYAVCGEDGRGYFDFGVFDYEEGAYKRAEANIKKALTFEPDNPYYHQYLGRVYLKTGQYKESEIALKRAQEIDPEISGLKYDLAYLYYKKEDYAAAYDFFKDTISEDPSNVLAHYQAGYCLFKLERYNEAADYFVYAAENSPTVSANGFYHAGLCYQNAGQYPKAIEMFERVKADPNAGALGESADKWIHAAKTRAKLYKSYSLYLKAGFQHDDNVRLEPVDEDIYSDESDASGVVYASGTYNFINKQDLRIGAGYSHYQTWHTDLDQFDLWGSIFHISAIYQFQTFSVGLRYIPAYYWVDGESYLRRHQIKPEITWSFGKKLTARLSYSFCDDDYFEDQNRTGHINEIFADVYYGILNGKGYLFGGIGYSDNSASKDFESYGRIRTRAGISFDIPWEIRLVLSGKYEKKEYDDPIPNYGVSRDDDKYAGALSLSRSIIYDWLGVIAEFEYTKNASNINDYEYDRKIAALSVTISF